MVNREKYLASPNDPARIDSSNNLAAGDESSASRIASASAVTRGLKKRAAGDAGPDFDSDRGQIGEATSVIFKLNIFDN